MHKWNFSSVAVGTNVGVVAVCETCGVIRSQNVPGTAHERHIDLRGNCSGIPQEPEDNPVEKNIQVEQAEDEPRVAFR